MKIIGFGHRKRVGKDTAVKYAMAYMRQTYPKIKCHILSFGDQIKNVAHLMYKSGGLEQGIYYENNPNEIEEVIPAIGRSPRQIWDEIGLMGRGIWPRTWVELAINSVPEADILFCKDVRGPTEIELIDSYRGWAFRIDREDVSKGGKVDELLADHKWDGIICNNGTHKELNTKIKDLCEKAVKIWDL